MAEQTFLDPSLKLRIASFDDVQAVARLSYDIAKMEGDTLFVMTAEELADAWSEEGFNVAQDVFVVETHEGHVVGSVEFYSEHEHRKFKADGCVHPEYRGMGIGSSLLEKMSERALVEMKLAEADAQVTMESLINNKNAGGHALLRNNGYSPVRYFWRMEVTLETAPASTSFPNGIELRPFIMEEHARAVWQAETEVFRDHWGSHEFRFEDWSNKLTSTNFDSSLWLVAWDGNQIAGFSQNRVRQGIGWIGTIGVRRPWRNRGLAIALLHHSFAEFYKRGMTTIGLGVDSANLTGATRVYERAGMHVASEHALYEKVLRTGKI